MMNQSPRPTRKRVNLFTLPRGLQYLISLAVIAIIVAAAWLTGSDEPTPGWITDILLPALPWVFFVLVGVAVVDWLRRKLKRRQP